MEEQNNTINADINSVNPLPLVSIVIPVHNGEKYIQQALESCFSQSYSNYEVIVVDDKSTDMTVTLLKQYLSIHPNLKVILAEKQNGLGNVINIGIKNSNPNAKYIARMDADDIMYPKRLETQVAYMEDHSDCVAVGGQIDIIDGDGHITGERKYALEDGKIKGNMFIFSPFAHPAVMLRKDAVVQVGYYPENMWKVEDVKFFFILSQAGRFANLDDKVLKYRVTFNTESQSDIVGHFKKTDEIRKWARSELHIEPSIKELVIWKLESVGVRILSLLPEKYVMNVFGFIRKVLS